MAYVDRINNEWKYATCSSLCYTSASQWSTVVVDSVTEVGDFTDIVVDKAEISILHIKTRLMMIYDMLLVRRVQQHLHGARLELMILCWKQTNGQ